MPTVPPSRCANPECHQLATQRGRCDDHQRPAWANTSRGWQSGSTRQWRKARAAQLQREPDCRACGAPATEVDHIVPLTEDGSRWDPANLQSLCTDCHDAKGLADRRRRRRPSRLTH